MLEAYKNFWLDYLDFYGRTKRLDYWRVVLINGVIGSLVFLLMYLLGQIKAAGFTLTDFILFIAEKYSTVCMYHIFSIRSSADGHLGCLQVLIVSTFGLPHIMLL